MNISNLRDSDYETKQESGGNDCGTGKIINIVPKPNLTTSSWSRLKDPRIVRVSRAFGGKDRHSKVCTVRGLRDRRVRLSVPTAIQLYDLQDRLGLNQPSKVVDWLLDAAKHEIDELPPLQIPPGSFGPGLQAMLNASTQSERIEGVKSSGLNWEDYWNPDKSKAIARETNEEHDDQEDSRNKHDQHQQHHHGTFVQSSNFFGRNPNSSSLPGLLNNVVPNNSFLKWDPSNLSLSQFGSYGSSIGNHHPHQDHDFNMNHVASINHPSSQLLLYPSPPQPPPPQPPQTQSYFPSHDHNTGEFDPKQQQLNFQMLSSSSTSSSHNPNNLSSNSNFTPTLYTINQGMRPFHLSMNPKFFSSEDDNGGHDHRSNE
ncbi:hypothetical protein L6452_44456 [Arctium lappa]|uniref:Uncharacterized protein n=1 Tax=Arctium lappa TaxID=4217 RepID=A0ACB8XG81_ARCLA|nr:hypothetical protein L6452_44456 [Arctium lappa]